MLSWKWARRIGGSGSAGHYGTGVGVDGTGHIYASGPRQRFSQVGRLPPVRPKTGRGSEVLRLTPMASGGFSGVTTFESNGAPTPALGLSQQGRRQRVDRGRGCRSGRGLLRMGIHRRASPDRTMSSCAGTPPGN